MTDLDQLRSLAENAALAAGAELMRRYGTVEGLDTKSTATDPVSDADRAAERMLVEQILAERPDDGVIGEEGASRPSRTGLTWVLDPLDGTVNYLYQLGSFSVSVGLEDADGGLIGVVHDPLTDRTFVGVRGQGAYLGDQRLQANTDVPMQLALVSTGFGYDPERRRAQGAFIARLLPNIRDVRRFGSAALDFCSVAMGVIDAYYEEGIHHWDRSAGTVIAREAGATVGPFTPSGQVDGWLVAGPALFAELQEFAAQP